MKTVLFLCTGNYYRSRFAEVLFNHLAAQDGLVWRAESRGLQLTPVNVGPISAHAVDGLARLGITLNGQRRMPIQATEEDLLRADHIVAAKRVEHFPLVERLFPAWSERIEFWEVHDIDFAEPADALPLLHSKVVELLGRLQAL